jgi:DNA invertase Pin-like site-specific DNA recombinase
MMPRELNRIGRAVIYLRIGASSEYNTNLIEDQRDTCKQLADGHELTIVREYVDIGRPARLDQQVELNNLLDDLEQLQDIEFVIAANSSRVASDLKGAIFVLAKIHKNQAELLTPGLDPPALLIAHTQQVTDWPTRRKRGE